MPKFVATFRVLLPPVAFTATGFLLNAQTGAGAPPPVMLLHDNVTCPVYPLAGVTLIVALAEFPELMDDGLNAVALTL